MKMRKMTAAALAAVLMAGTVSLVAIADDTEVWTDEEGIMWNDTFEVREEDC